MRTRIGWLVAVALALAPAAAHAQTNQDYEVPPSPYIFPGPFGHPRMEEGGFYVGMDALWWTFTNPLRNQVVATRGFVDYDGSILGHGPGANIGGDQALNVQQVTGPGTYTPGFNLLTGWRFENGVTLQFNWIHLVDVRYSAQATLVPPGFNLGNQLQNTFLFSPVVNFPVNYAGDPQNLGIGNPNATFGIWNAATEMQIQFLQRFEQFDFGGRIPTWGTQDFRTYGLLGARIAWIWERFKWRTVDANFNGNATADEVADYSNIVSNRLYGVHAGCGSEWFLGDTAIGAFSVSVEGEVGGFLDYIKARARYELEDRSTAAQRARRFQTFSPMASGNINLWWYPFEAIQITLGYDVLAYFNTMASRQPIDFNFAAITPGWDKNITRVYHGVRFGIGITF